MKNNQFIFLTVENNQTINAILSDLINDKRADIYKIFPQMRNRILKLFRTIHCSVKANNILPFPFREIWHNALDDIQWKKDVEYYIVFISIGTFSKLPMTLWSKLKKKYNIHYVMYFWNLVKDMNTSPYVFKCLSTFEFDYIFTFDFDDAAKYNYIYYPTPYSMLSDNYCNEITNDICLVAGNYGGKLKTLHRLYNYFKKSNVKMLFRIVGVSSKEQKYSNEIIYNKMIGYNEVVEEVKKSNCILEVLATEQTGASLRYYEAICYNKKLLTNNKDVVNLPLYDPRYMKIFEKPEDIDIEWIKNRENIDYHYDGRFSPSRFIDKIIELEKEKEGSEFGKK